jgi:hypothetical protein
MVRSSPFAVLGLVGILLGAWWSRGAAGAENPPPAPAPVITPQQIEADWLRQDVVRNLPPAPLGQPGAAARKVTTADDAAGGCDGLKDGTYGFHTDADASPWWHVDLGRSLALDRVAVFNRCDGKVEDRAGNLAVLLSDDGKRWRELYKHGGAKFFGQSDGKPLVVPAAGAAARFVRVQLPSRKYFHLDEVEVYAIGGKENVALRRPADQSSVSQWSKSHLPPSSPVAANDAAAEPAYPTAQVVQGGLRLAESLRQLGADVTSHVRTLDEAAAAWKSLPSGAPGHVKRDLYFRARWAVRRMALVNPLLDFDNLLLVKRVPGSFTHMSDQYYGWFSRPGGGLYVLEGFKTDAPRLRCLSGSLPAGSVLRPDLSYDGRRVVFAHCKFYPGVAGHPNKLDKNNIPEDAFYHLYEMNLDGTGLRRLTHGKYDDFDARYLPGGEIVFLSTRRGQYVQCGKSTAESSAGGQHPDCYVRCGGGPERPVAVYTLHVMDAEGKNLRQISPFEMFEWTPSVDDQGRILYARWDYVDRHNMPYMSLWSTMPDGTNAQAVFKNYTRSPHTAFEARSIPGSRRLIFTAGGHHAFTGGSLVLLDYNKAADGEAAMKRLTPEVCMAETEGWPQTYFTGPFPLSEEHYLVGWSDRPLPPGVPHGPGFGWGSPGPPNDLGLYLFDAFGNLNLVYRDPALSSETPIPVRPRPMPHQIDSHVAWDGQQEGRMVLLNVQEGLDGIPAGTVRRLRIVGVPAKTHPTMNSPSMGMTTDDPGKFVMGTVPVEDDGSAYFRVPSGVTLFVQALDREGVAVQTMRSAAYVQAGQTYTCVGCHEPRNTSPANAMPAAIRREPSRIALGPEGSWPLDYEVLVQPLLERQCVGCHKPGGKDEKYDLTAAKSYDSLVNYGSPSLKSHVQTRYAEGRSTAGAGAAATSPLVKLLRAGHYEVKLSADDWGRLLTWMDTYGQRRGSFSPEQAARLEQLKRRMEPMLAQ